MISLFEMIQESVRRLVQKLKEFQSGGNLDLTMLRDGVVELLVEDASVLLPFLAVSHEGERPVPTHTRNAL